jgi:hypothetical protein
MPLMSLAQTRVVDPVLTGLSQGYSNSEFVGKYLFPMVPVTEYGGVVVQFADTIFELDDLSRGPDGEYKVVHTDYDGSPYKLSLKGAKYRVPFEHATDAERLGFQWDSIANMTMMAKLNLELEVEQATIATNTANYDSNHRLTLSGTDQWSDPASTPSADIRAAKSAIRSSVGKDGNIVLLTSATYDAVVENPAIIDRFKHTSKDSITADMLATLWEVDKVVVGKAVRKSGSSVSDIWGKVAIVAYTNPSAIASGMLNGFQMSGDVNMFMPSWGYTYTMTGHPFQKPVRRDEDKDSFIYQTKFDRVPVLTGMDSAFLFSAAVA